MPLRTKAHWFGVVLGTDDVPRLSRFYADLLGWRVFTEEPDWVTLAPSEDAGYNIGVQHEEHHVRPTWPGEAGAQQMQLHLDLEVDSLDEAVAHATACGADLPEHQPQDDVRVLLDPAGHPFCVYTSDD